MPIELGQYTLIAEIGRGGMAAVYLASHQKPSGAHELVVVKEPRFDADEEAVLMFLDEAHLMARLDHPKVVRTIAVGQSGGRNFIVLEYLRGQPLSRLVEVLGEHERLLPLVVHCLCEALEGLHFAHELTGEDGHPLDVVHRDVTPHNVFCTYDGKVKLMDFGIAKTIASRVQTRAGVLKGKLKYMAPEQVSREALDRRADIYAVGIVLWECLTGRPMYAETSDAAVIHRVLTGTTPRARDIAPEAPEALLAAADRALAPDRNQRFASADEMRDALRDYLDRAIPRPSAEELGRVLTEQFEDERRDAALIAEAHLADLHAPISASTSAQSVSTTTHPISSEAMARTGWLPLVGLAAVGAVAVVATQVCSHHGPSPTEVTAPQETIEVELSVSVSPEQAEVFLDDHLLGTGTYRGRLPLDGRSHQLRVESPGFAPQIETFEADDDIELNIELTAEP